MQFFVTVLGSSSATPTDFRNPSAQTVHYENNIFLVDCGEGTQMQMLRFRIKANRINHIFISHLHGDHYLGLMGLLSTYHLNGRQKEVHIYSPKGLEEIIELQKKVAATKFTYETIFHILDDTTKNPVYEDDKLFVNCIKLEHRIPTYGFLFKEKPKEIKIRKEAIETYELSVEDILNIKAGSDFITDNGKCIPPEKLIYPEIKTRSFAYISDTAYNEKIINHIMHVDLLYHEATFAEDMKRNAAEKFHSTAIEAALIAKYSNANKLIIGHFSARYGDVSLLLSEARSLFSNTYTVEDGIKYEV